jgi:hypothetical protein
MEKERLYLTDITLHTRDFRQTTQYSKVAQKGRMYMPFKPQKPSGDEQKSAISDIDDTNRTFKLHIKFPSDLQERIDRGEVELMIPKDGLLVFAGKDAFELAEAMAKKERREGVHEKYGKKAWLDGRE